MRAGAQIAETGPLSRSPALCLIALGGLAIYRSRHLHAPLPPLPEDTDQTHVGALYLGAFKQEARVFAIVASGTQLDALKESHLTDERGNSYFTFEEYLRREIAMTIGSFQALGNPEDISPPSSGAARLYARDAEWKQRVADLARRAKCIVMELGSSGNLRWRRAQLRLRRGVAHGGDVRRAGPASATEGAVKSPPPSPISLRAATRPSTRRAQRLVPAATGFVPRHSAIFPSS